MINVTTVMFSNDSVTVSSLTSMVSDPQAEDSHQVWLFVLLPVTVLLCCGLVIALVVMLLKKNRMDKLRQHLMPMYTLDPEDSGGDWEANLLEAEVKLRRDSASSPQTPILKMCSMHSEL